MTNLLDQFLEFLSNGGKFKVLNLEIPIYGLIAVIIASVLIFFISQLIRRWFHKIVKRNDLSPDVYNAVKLLVRIFFGAINIWIILKFLGIEADYFLFLSGLTATAIAFASMKTINNFIAGIWIALAHPYLLGDYVKIGDIEGIVINIASTYTKIKFRDGTQAFVPNLECLGSNILNYTRSIPIIQEKIDRMERELQKLMKSKKKGEESKNHQMIQQIQAELLEQQEMISEIQEYETTLEKINKTKQEVFSDFVQKGKIVKYIFTLDLPRQYFGNKGKLNKVCKKWIDEFTFRPKWDLINMGAHFTYQFTIITPDPMDIINYHDDFVTELYIELYTKVDEN